MAELTSKPSASPVAMIAFSNSLLLSAFAAAVDSLPPVALSPSPVSDPLSEQPVARASESTDAAAAMPVRGSVNLFMLGCSLGVFRVCLK